MESVQTDSIGRPAFASLRSLLAANVLWIAVVPVIATAGAFLLHQLMAWPPHEDETLALFVGRDSLGGVIEHVTRERGGAPLHFILAWLVAHAGLGLGGLRLLSVAFALGSLPLVALLGRRAAGTLAGVIATAIVACSWMFLFHGVYGRMYSLFLFLSLASLLTLFRALDRGGRTWAWWVTAILLTIAAHPYGVLFAAGQGLFVLLGRRDRLQGALRAGGAVLVLGTPFWLTDLVLAGRFEVGVGGGGANLGGPLSVAEYFWHTVGDFTTGSWPMLAGILALAGIGLWTVQRDARLLALCVGGVPALAFLAARLGGSASPESRHLIFVLPLFGVLVAAGLARTARRSPAIAIVFVGALLATEVAWAWHRTPPLFEWEPDLRQTARAEAEAYLASTSRPDDVLFGYEPLYLGAWERNPAFPRTVVPRADARLALRVLQRQTPVGRGIWVLDASERNNLKPRLDIQARDPGPPGAFEIRAFGPFLVLRSREPAETPDRYLFLAGQAMRLGRALGIGDADVNLLTTERAYRELRASGRSLSFRSSSSR